MIRAAVLSFALMTAPVLAQDDPAALARQAAADLAVAFVALEEAEKSRDRVAALTLTIRAHEAGLSAFREALRRAAIRERAIQLDLDAKRDRISRLLGVMQTMEGAGAPLLLLHPSGPIGTARSGMILSDVTPALQAEANILKAQLEEVTLLRSLQEGAAQTLTEGLESLQSARTALSKAVADRTDLPKRIIDQPEKLAALVTGAETLAAFADGLAADEASADPADFTAQKGALPLPLEATLLRAFDEADAAGIRRPGMILAARPRAMVTTPWPATIRYAGPLLDYGNVMILEPGEGYLLVLAGLAEVYGEAGQVLPADTPVGLMGGADPASSTFLTTGGQATGPEQSETLYIELRVGEDPVDPVPWFALDKD